MSQVNIRIDNDLKEAAERLFAELGLTMSTALTMFLRQAVRQGGIPFAVSTRSDLFYNPTNLEYLRQSLRQLEAGQTVTRSVEALDRMADA
ncbi:MAG: type II toxin-antitoxin system RelB/DinJ family antitoxin [Bifidobacteriaceae bacterium]|jgi:DNA-damage-inducible protein J|nr:type II toxin-antitoxin system RelB/DinJ family antitoxin [Bifidobacteriaceae bacterium]